ncbi:MAG TPA: thymidine phosphorylase [Armatimonadota bacterium]|jgi:pyrimidine-nucleoside phosphorylase
MSFLHLIEAKRDGKAFTREQMHEAVSAFLPDSGVPEYQLGAFLMAMFLRGLNEAEVPLLAFALRDSGVVLRFPTDDPRPVVDKHSTGGVGDKVTLPLVPLLACLGFRVPMVSGRGLGITGGTLDKLESVPGFTVRLSAEELVERVQMNGGVICGDSRDIAPADHVMYGLRDVTGTVDSISVTTASILSNKLAEGLDALILDAKFGAAACTRELPRARELAQAMTDLGNACGVKTRALLTDMEAPLGRAAGNWVEVKESVLCLEGRGPEDLTDVVVDCAAHLMDLTGLAPNLAAARAAARACLASGEPRRRWDAILAAQGSDIEALNRKLALDHTAPFVVEVTAERTAFISALDARVVGEIVRDLGAGRFTKDDALDYDVGVDALAKPGESVVPGAVLARVHARTAEAASAAALRLSAAFAFADAPPPARPLVLDVVR